MSIWAAIGRLASTVTPSVRPAPVTPGRRTARPAKPASATSRSPVAPTVTFSVSTAPLA